MEQPHLSSSDTQRKRKLTHYKAHNSTTELNDLPDDVLVDILSHLVSRNEAARTSVLSRRWRYLWRSLTAGTLELDDHRDMFSSEADLDLFSSRPKQENLSNKIITRVNHALKSHQRLPLDGLVIRFAHLHSLLPLHHLCISYIDKWIRFAVRKEVKILELSFSKHIRRYEFPSRDLNGSLRSLILTGVDIRDEVVQHYLASCPYLQRLCIRRSQHTVNLRVVDPLSPNLKVLEISKCGNFKSLKVSSMNLVSCTYRGRNIDLPFLDTPNLSELALGGNPARSFLYEPHKHSTYSEQLLKLTLDVEDFGTMKSTTRYKTNWPSLCSLKHLELNMESSSAACPNISFSIFTSLVKAAPLLNEFCFKMFYPGGGPWRLDNYVIAAQSLQKVGVDPEVIDCHKNLKTVNFSGYVGCSYDDLFVLHLLMIAPSIEMVTIDTEINYRIKEPFWLLSGKGGRETRIEAIKRAENLSSSFPPNTVLLVT